MKYKNAIVMLHQDIIREVAKFLYPDAGAFLLAKTPKIRLEDQDWEIPAYTMKACEEIRGKVFDNSKCLNQFEQSLQGSPFTVTPVTVTQ